MALHNPSPGWRGFLPSRGPILRRLERGRLLARSVGTAKLYDFLQRLLLGPRSHGYRLQSFTGERFANVPAELALSEPIVPERDDVVFITGSDWLHRNLPALATQKRARGFAVAALCYDLIPVEHPHFFPPGVACAFREFWIGLLSITDLAIVNSLAVNRDLIAFCERENRPVPPSRRIALSDEAGGRVVPSALPPELAPGRYALFVSTIEPRKNHRLLIDVWHALMRERRLQEPPFALVFAGKTGWLVDDIMRDISASRSAGLPIHHIDGPDDATLEALYMNAAFCLYPSITEGFGLPVVEAARRGKPMLISDGGSLAEFGAIACVTPLARPRLWVDTIAQWISDPAARMQPDLLPVRDWDAVANEVFGAIRALRP